MPGGGERLSRGHDLSFCSSVDPAVFAATGSRTSELIEDAAAQREMPRQPGLGPKLVPDAKQQEAKQRMPFS